MILTVGCSFTAGEELAHPDRDSWPVLVGKFLNKPVKNLGLRGGSNEYIFRTAIEETSKQLFDLVVVEWSDPSRIEVWHPHKSAAISVTAHSRYADMSMFKWVKEMYANHQNDFHDYRRTYCLVIALQEYFKSIGQRYIFTNLSGLHPHGTWEEFNTLLSHLWNKVNTNYFLGWPHEGFLEWQGDCDRGPNGHPLELGHQRIAEKINEHIRHLGWVS